jgi:hypothetical protein
MPCTESEEEGDASQSPSMTTPMKTRSCTESEEEGDASQSPSMTTPMKTSSNSWACHGEQDTETESEEEESYLEQQCCKAKGKLRKVSGWLEYEVQETWDTEPESTLERADTDNQILKRMTKFMTYSRLFKTPRRKPQKTDIYLWNLYSKEYYSKRSDETIRIHKCPMAYRCSCTERCRVCVGKDYIRLEFHGTHDETSHAEERSKNLRYKQIIAIHKAVIVAPNLSATKSRCNLQNASPEKHVQPALLRSIQRCVRETRKEPTVRESSVCGMVPKSVEQLHGW